MPESHLAYLRRVLAADPEVEPGVTVVNIDTPHKTARMSGFTYLDADLSDGTTIRLTIRREPRR